MKLAEAKTVLQNESEQVPPQLHRLLQETGGSRKAASIFLSKYCRRDAEDNLLETSMEEVWKRVSKGLCTPNEAEEQAAYIDALREDLAQLEGQLLQVMMNKEYIFGGRVAASIGINKKTSAYNCYVIPSPDDSLDSIFDTIKYIAKTQSRGGGTGVDLSLLRPEGTPVGNSANSSTGPVPFMDIISKTTGTIGQNQRRGAQMITLSVEHPDIEKFIDVKQYDREAIDDSVVSYVRGEVGLSGLKDAIAPMYSVNHANISVLLSDKFLQAVEKDKEFELHWESADGKEKVTKTVRAKAIWDKIIKNAWSTGEPGLLFWDKMKAEHNGEYYAPLASTNPCAEEPLPGHDACCLGHINLAALVRDSFSKKAFFDLERFVEVIHIAVRGLDRVVSFNASTKHQAYQEQVDMALKGRRIGLGVTGLGDMFFRLGIAYGSTKSKKLLKDIMFALAYEAYKESIEQAKKYGAFPAFQYDKFIQSTFMQRLLEEIKESGDTQFKKDLKEFGIRNVTLLTIAPVGTGSEVLGLGSSGVEPIFAPSYTRTVFFAEGKKDFTEYVPSVREYMTSMGKDTLPDYFVSAHDILPEQRIEMQALMQRYIDTSISSTINLPYSATVEDVSKIYQMAWKSGLKSITVYREGSREDVIRISGTKNRPLLKKLFKSSRDLIAPRPTCLRSATYAVNYYPNYRAYVTIGGNLKTGTPVEVLIRTKRVEDETAAKVLGILLTAQLRRDSAMGVSSRWVIDELNAVKEDVGVFHKDSFNPYPKSIKGLTQAVAYALELFMDKKFSAEDSDDAESNESGDKAQMPATLPVTAKTETTDTTLEICPVCGFRALAKTPCDTCLQCGYSKCT